MWQYLGFLFGSALICLLVFGSTTAYTKKRAVFQYEAAYTPGLLQSASLANIHGAIVYQTSCPWERDYIVQDILADVAHWPVEGFVSASGLADALQANTSSEFISRPSILVFNDPSFEDVVRVVGLLKPRVIIHLSDESGDRPDMVGLAGMVPLLLRQYMHPHYPRRPNMFQIPLGYMANMTRGTSAIRRHDIPRMKDRGLQWAFVGNVKQDRAIMIKTFSAVLGDSYHTSNNALPGAFFDIYKNAVFIPNGRGWRVLDCFRLYEASLSGAIPVIVGPWAEIRESLYFGGDIPPWIFEENWDAAAARCAELLNNGEALQAMQDQILKWWERQIIQTRTQVRMALKGRQVR